MDSTSFAATESHWIEVFPTHGTLSELILHCICFCWAERKEDWLCSSLSFLPPSLSSLSPPLSPPSFLPSLPSFLPSPSPLSPLSALQMQKEDLSNKISPDCLSSRHLQKRSIHRSLTNSYKHHQQITWSSSSRNHISGWLQWPW